MPRPAALAALACLLPLAAASGQDTDVFPVIGEITSFDDRFAECLAGDAKIEVLASGFDWCEGPAWDSSGGENGAGRLLFSEIPSNTVRAWEPRKAVRVFLEPSGYTGSLDYGGEPGSNGLLVVGRDLISCEHGDRRLSVMPLDRPGGKVTLVDRFEGKRLNSPNDLCRREDGTIYFTDPPYGLPGGFESDLRELDFCGVYRLTPDGELSVVTRDMPRPNGLDLSKGQDTLYVADSGDKLWRKFPVDRDGSTGEGSLFFDASDKPGPGSADGLKIDQNDRIWATGPGGVWVFDPDGTPLGLISTGVPCSNVVFGGRMGKDLFITSDMYLCRVRTKVTSVVF